VLDLFEWKEAGLQLRAVAGCNLLYFVIFGALTLAIKRRRDVCSAFLVFSVFIYAADDANLLLRSCCPIIFYLVAFEAVLFYGVT
jgi:hypothetical protein